MADRMTPAERSRCMAAIKGKNTKPELIVRKFLFAKGLRYRLHDKRLPGTPDIVLPKYHVAVFVNGCFWHGHENCRHSHLPETNHDFWQQKISLNIARDKRTEVELRLKGWRVIRVWECGLKDAATRQSTLMQLYSHITSPLHKPNAATRYAATYSTPAIAAESGTHYGRDEE